MILDRLLGNGSRQSFLDDFFLRLPFSMPGTAAEMAGLATWDRLEAILARPEADAMVVRQGRRHDPGETPSGKEYRTLHESGHTILVRHAERNDAALADLAREFEEEFRAPVDLHIYCTPGEEYGFGWHYDAEDVFILQSSGSKEYSLRKNTVNPWPLAETMPRDMRYEREIMPVMQCLLEPGDWVYIPHGYWHVGRAQEPSISLAVGLLMPSAVDVYDSLRQRLLDSPLWRQRLPVIPHDESADERQVSSRYEEIFAQLGDDLSRALRDPALLRAWLESRDRSEMRSE